MKNNNKIEVVRILPGTTNDLEFYASWQRVESKKTELLKWSLITISSSIIVIGVEL